MASNTVGHFECHLLVNPLPHIEQLGLDGVTFAGIIFIIVLGVFVKLVTQLA